MNQPDIERLKARLDELFRSPTQEEIAASIAQLKAMGRPFGEIIEYDLEEDGLCNSRNG